MVQSNLIHLHQRAEFHNRRRAHALLRYINTVYLKPKRNCYIQEFLSQHKVIRVLPGLQQLLPALRLSSPQRQYQCSIDMHELMEFAHDSQFITELPPNPELEVWMLIYMINEQLYGEEGWLPTGNKSTIMFGAAGTLYSARHFGGLWNINAFSSRERHAIRWPKGTHVLSFNTRINYH